jgi:hypothetical protein
MVGQNSIIVQRPAFTQAVLRKRTYRTAGAVLKDQAGDRLGMLNNFLDLTAGLQLQPIDFAHLSYVVDDGNNRINNRSEGIVQGKIIWASVAAVAGGQSSDGNNCKGGVFDDLFHGFLFSD